MRRLPSLASCAKVALVGCALAILAVPIWLAPNPTGPGTTPQLFPPCSVGVDGPIRCPTCGLTSGMSALLRGRPLEALQRNLLVPLVAALLLATLYLAGGSLAARRPVLELPGALWMFQRAGWVPVLAAGLYLAMHLWRA